MSPDRSRPIQIPQSLWQQTENAETVLALRLRDGRCVDEVLVSESGEVLGIVVGGMDGITTDGLDFDTDEIVAIRRRDGVLGRAKLTRWRT